MLSRLTTQSIRGLSHSSKLVSRFQGGAPTVAKRAAFNVHRTASTLKGRLLGPITGKSYRYGSYVMGGGSALCVGLFSLNSQGDDKENAWPQYVRDRLIMIYGYTAASLSVAITVGVAARRSAAFMKYIDDKEFRAAFAVCFGIFATSIPACSIPYEYTMAKHAAWLIHTASIGSLLAFGPPTAVINALTTAALVAGLSAVAIMSPSEQFLAMEGPLNKGIIIVTILTFALSPLRDTRAAPAMASLVLLACFLLFSGNILHDTQRAIKNAKECPLKEQSGGWFFDGSKIKSFDPISSSMDIYSNTILLSRFKAIMISM